LEKRSGLVDRRKERQRFTKKKSPASRRDLPAYTSFECELATALTLLIGFLALTVRILPIRILPVWILLLLSGLLPTALLLTGLLARVLVLLTRVLVLIGHRDLPC
jgi:hypothetical protein